MNTLNKVAPNSKRTREKEEKDKQKQNKKRHPRVRAHPASFARERKYKAKMNHFRDRKESRK